MTNYKIKLYSKDKKSFNNFFKFIRQESSKFKSFPIFLKISKEKNKRKKLTILKSPHVNKKAQEQYQVVTYTNQISCLAWNEKKNSVFLKHIKNHIFPGIKIHIKKNVYNKHLTKKLFINIQEKIKNETLFITLNPQNKKKLFIRDHFVKNPKLFKKMQNTLKLLDNCGHFYIYNTV